VDRIAFHTKDAQTVEETGLPESLVRDLMLKQIFFAAQLSCRRWPALHIGVALLSTTLVFLPWAIRN